MDVILRLKPWGDPRVTIWDVIPMMIYHTTRRQAQKTEIFVVTALRPKHPCDHSVTALRPVGVLRGLMRRERARERESEGAGGQIPTKVGPPAIQT